MECSSRTILMGLILRALGYETRVVAIFDSRTNLKSHSFLEVINPATGRWETQDADFDIGDAKIPGSASRLPMKLSPSRTSSPADA